MMKNRTAELRNIKKRIDRRFSTPQKLEVKVRVLKSISKKLINDIKPSEINDEKLWRHYVYYVINKILVKSEKGKFKSETKKRGFVAINYEDLKKVLSVHTTIVLQTLLDHNIIECDNHFIINIVSKGYKISKKYNSDKTRFLTLKHPAFLKRYIKSQEEYMREEKLLLFKNAHLVKWFLDDGLEIDKLNATKYINDVDDKLKSMINHSKLDKKSSKKIKLLKSINQTVLKAKSQIENFNLKLPRFSHKSGRMYTSVSALMSVSRNFLKYKGEELVYFDIANSQPYHFIHFLNPKTWSQTKRTTNFQLSSLNKILNDHLMSKGSIKGSIKGTKEEDSIIIKSLKLAYKLGKSTTNKGIIRDSTAAPNFAHLVATGKFYKFICENFKGLFIKKNGDDPFKDPKSSKIELIKMFYSNNRNKYSLASKYFKRFQKLFPLESEIILLLKSRHYKDFSILLQKIESEIILGLVCKKIHSLNPDIPLFTIHDGILTTHQYQDVVNTAIKEAYKESIGILPEVKIEYLNQSNAYKELDQYSFKKIDSLLTKLKLTSDINPDYMIDSYIKRPVDKFIEPHDLFVDYSLLFNSVNKR